MHLGSHSYPQNAVTDTTTRVHPPAYSLLPLRTSHCEGDGHDHWRTWFWWPIPPAGGWGWDSLPPLSFLLWIIFLVLMPVLLSNLLVSYKIFWSCCSRLLSQVLGAKSNIWWLHWIAWLCAKESNSIIRCPQTVLYSTCVMTELELLMSQLFVKFLGTFSSIDSVSGWFWCVHCKEHLPTSLYRYLHQTACGSVHLVNHCWNEPVPDTYIIRTLRSLPCVAHNSLVQV